MINYKHKYLVLKHNVNNLFHNKISRITGELGNVSRDYLDYTNTPDSTSVSLHYLTDYAQDLKIVRKLMLRLRNAQVQLNTKLVNIKDINRLIRNKNYTKASHQLDNINQRL